MTNNTERSVAEVGEELDPWPGYSEQSWKERFNELSRRHSETMVQLYNGMRQVAAHRTEAEARVGEVDDASDDKLVAALECCVRNGWGTCTIGLADIPRALAALKPTEPGEAKIERVARALHEETMKQRPEDQRYPFYGMEKRYQDFARDHARAALVAAEGDL